MASKWSCVAALFVWVELRSVSWFMSLCKVERHGPQEPDLPLPGLLDLLWDLR